MLRTTRSLIAGFALAVAPFISSLGLAEVEITHKPLADVVAGSRLTLAAEVENEAAGIDLVRLYFRAGGEDYVFVAMQPEADDAGTFTATMPALAQNTRSLDYFLLVRSGDGSVVKSQNFTAEVSAGAAQAAAGQVILQPSEFARVAGYHGRLVKLVGNVHVVGTDGGVRSAGDAGYVVKESETLRTGPDGRVVVDFDGDPITVLEEASRLNVRTPWWLTHLAGRAYFAFKRLLDVGQPERTVASTVALIGIRGTDFLSYADRGVALAEGGLAIGSPAGQALEVTRDGVASSSLSFDLTANQYAGFDGQKVEVGPRSPVHIAHTERARQFAAGAVGDTVTVTAEASPMPLVIAGVSDNVLLVQAPRAAWLGIAAAGSTVVAGTGGISTTAGVVLGVLGVGVIAGASGGSSGGGGDSGDNTPPDDKPSDPPSKPGFGSDFVGVTLRYMTIDGEAACLEITDPCGQITSQGTPTQICGGFSSTYTPPIDIQGVMTERIEWSSGAPAGSYTRLVRYCGTPGGALSFDGDLLVSPNPASTFSGRLTPSGTDSATFSVP